MSNTLTYHSIQNVQLCHHNVGKGIGPYAPAPAQAQAHAPAYAPPALADAYAHANAITPAGHTHMPMHPHRNCGIV
ncbi:hypothetical protein O181_072559 [Austropuccinia psidii MF-1]|uniref:Uncharacterized protein n=1 Tax=Austropuccinia psidii MF-1 TaxID=1389203 RepID=A0A9Q3F507_9BASI|nr:hypothetical protein [Austropuccinia psidii MF-1]